ncbi:MAG: PDZ domain-containing protein [bacterium]|nr:PDZ domain-containing protein [bacterium]
MRERRDGMSGTRVTKIEPQSPAEQAGMKRGDIVLAIDGTLVERDRSFFEALSTSLVGQTIELQLWRAGEIITVEVEGADLPDQIVHDLVAQFLGMQLTRDAGQGFTIRKIQSDYPAAAFGLRDGDTIVSINGRPLAGPNDLRRAMVDLRRDYASTYARNRVLLDIRRGRARRHFSLPSYEAYTAMRQRRQR